MSNPDVPSCEACKRLAKAGYGAPARHFYDTATGKLYGKGVTIGGTASSVAREVAEQLRGVLAPTIGEMLEEIRRRGWGAEIRDDLREGGTVPVNIWRMGIEAGLESDEDVIGRHEAESITDAMALALAEAIEKEGK